MYNSAFMFDLLRNEIIGIENELSFSEHGYTRSQEKNRKIERNAVNQVPALCIL